MNRYIDADALIEKLSTFNDRVHGDTHFICGIESAKEIIQNEPTVDAEPVRHGTFIGTEYDGYADGYPVYYEWKCSECGCIFEEEEPTYKYCPNCGARMDGAEPKE